MNTLIKHFFCCFIFFVFPLLSYVGLAQNTTLLQIKELNKSGAIDPMIYGQMLENVNDSMIYGGVANMQGEEQQHITPLIRDLNVPVVRWPGGTVVYEYHWRNGIGPRSLRPVVPTLAWQGKENYQFGTDEFLQWCNKVKTEPYINFNMSTHPLYVGTLREALEWIEYVNGDLYSDLGKLRAHNGHADPYGVKYWGIGNENYLISRAARVQDEDTVYAERLGLWAATIKKKYPDLRLLGVGHTSAWNDVVMERAGKYVDFLTQHYYVNAKVKAGALQEPYNTLFAPAKMEAHLKLLGKHLKTMNEKLQRSDNPVRLSVDEWNNRHGVYNGDEYKFSRQSIRKQFDVAVTAGMLNAFIRQSPAVGMANYIFPVNAHGLIRTIGTDDAFFTPLYYLFKEYRHKMIGHKVDVIVKGPGIAAKDLQLNIAGDCAEAVLDDESLPFIDAAAVLNDHSEIYIAVVNRSANTTQQVMLDIPGGWSIKQIWELSSKNINAYNDAAHRSEITPVIKKVKKGTKKIQLQPCAVAMLHLINEK